MTLKRKNWRWYLVVDDQGSIKQGFNSYSGAETYVAAHGGIIVPVKEVKLS